MNVRDAKICLVCDEIYVGDDCPRCGGNGWYIAQWMQPTRARLEGCIIAGQEQLELFRGAKNDNDTDYI